VTARHLRTSAFASREELSDALQGLFVSELLTPSRPLWIITPWISDVALVDNRAGRFSGLLPDLPQRWIRLAELLLQQLTRGGSIVIACRPDLHNESFTGQFSRRCEESGLGSRVLIRFAEDLHEKGLLTSQILLSGSMNLTFNGLRRLEESVLLSDDPDTVARARHAYEDRWGRP
jgi:hypothetical protein